MNKCLIYVIRTKSVSGNVLNVVNFICDEFIVSKQTAKKMIQEGSLIVCLGSDKDEAIEHVKYYKKHGLNTEYGLEDASLFFEIDCNTCR